MLLSFGKPGSGKFRKNPHETQPRLRIPSACPFHGSDRPLIVRQFCFELRLRVMKPTANPFFRPIFAGLHQVIHLTLVVSAAWVSTAWSADLYWDSDPAAGGSTGTTAPGIWGTDAFWNTDSGGAPGILTAITTNLDDLHFSASTDVTGASAVTVNGAQSANRILFEEGAITLGGGTSITLGGGGGADTGLRFVDLTGANAINTALVLDADATFTNTVAFTQAINGGVTGAFNLTLNANGANGFSFGTGTINNGGTITNSGTGAGSVTINTAIGSNVTSVIQNSTTSRLVLNGIAATPGSFGSLVVKAGTVEARNNGTVPLGTAAITLGDSVANTSDVSLIFQGTSASFSNAITLESGTTGLITIGTINGNTPVTFSGGITGTNNFQINNGLGMTPNAQPLNFTTGALNNTGTITNVTSGGAGGVVISSVIGSNVTGVIQNSAAPGKLRLSGANTYSGATTVTQGTLEIFGGGSLAGSAVSAAAGATFQVSSDATIGTAGNASVTIAGGAGAGGGVFSLLGGTINTVNINSATPGATVLTMGGTAGNASQLNMEVGATSDRINLGSGLVASIGAGGVTVNITSLGGLDGTTQTLISAPGGGLTTGGGFTLNAASGNFGGNILGLTNSGTALQLTQTANAEQATLYFKGNQGTSWSAFANGNANNSNWTTDAAGNNDALTAPTAITDVHFYTTNATLASLATTLGRNFTIKSLTTDGGALSNNISVAGGGGILTITPTDPTTGVTVNSGSGTLTISAPVVLGSSQTWTNNSASLLSSTGGITGTANLTLKANSTAGITFSAVAANHAGTITNSGTGSGTSTFSGIGPNVTAVNQASNTSAVSITNTFGVTVNSGGTIFTSTGSALLGNTGAVGGTGNLEFRTNSSGNITSSGAINHTGTITVSGTGSGLTTLGAIGANVGNISLTGSGTTTATFGAINNTGSITNAGTTSGVTTIGGIIGTNVTGVLQNSTTSQLTLTGANTFTSGLVVKAGTARGQTSASAFGAGTVTLGDTLANSSAVTLVGNFGGTISNAIVLASGTTGTISITSPNTGTLQVFSGGVTGTNNLSVGGTSTQGLRFSTGAINNTGTVTGIGTGSGATIIDILGPNVTSVSQAGSSAFRIDSAFALTATNRTLVSTGTGLFSFTGGITGSQNLVLNANAGGGITLGTGAINNAGTITNSGTGAGTSTLSGAVGSNVTALIQNSTTSAMTVSGALSVNAGGTTLTNTAGTRLLTLTGGVTGTGNLTVNNDSATANGVTFTTGAINHTGTFTNSGTGTGAQTVGVVIGANVTGVTQNSATSSLNLSGVNLYTGATNVSAGTLILSGAGASNSSSGFTINGTTAKLVQTSSVAMSPNVTLTQGTLDGTGTISNLVNVGAAGAASTKIITAGNGAGGALTIGTLTFNGAATVNLAQAGAPNAAGSTKIVTTNLNADGAPGSVVLNVTNSGTYTGGVGYDLITYGTLGAGDFANFGLGTVTGLGGRQTAALNDSGTAIQLMVTGSLASLNWTGALSNEWSTATLAAPKNWLNGAVQDDFILGDNVTFDNSATSFNVNIAGANVTPTSTTFNNTTAYTLGSTGGFGIATGTLTKNGTGNLTITNNTNTYAGATTIQNGRIIVGVTNALPTGTSLILGNNATGAGATHGTLDLTNFSQTIGGLTVLGDSTTVTAADSILIGAGKTLTVNGSVSIGQTAGATAPKLTATGGGAMVVNGATFQIGANTSSATNVGSNATVDFSGLSSFEATLSGNFNIGDNSTGNSGKASSLYLPTTGAGNTTITAAAITVGTQGRNSSGQVNELRLGSGANVFNTASFNVGAANGTARDAGSVTFANSSGTLKIRDVAGTGRAAFTVSGGGSGSNTGVARNSTFDVKGHNADLLVSTLTIGDMNGTGLSTNVFSFDTGILDATTVNIGRRGSTATSTSAHTYTVNFGTNSSSTGVVNIGTGGITLLNQASTVAGAGSVNSTLNVLGGTVTLAGNITQVVGAGGAPRVGTLTVDGGTLDMGGNRIGGAAAANNIDVLNFRSGTLRNVAEINNGAGLTKTSTGTLTLGGANNYTGATTVAEGKLSVVGTLNATTSIIVQSAGTLELGADQRILDSASLSLVGGGRFNTQGFDETIGTLQLTGDNNILDLAAGTSVIQFANSSGVAWGSTLNILNWTGTATTGGGIDQVRFGTDSSGLTNSQIASIFFVNPFGDGNTYNAQWSTGLNGELVPGLVIPEPSAFLLGALGGLGLVLRRKRRA